MASLKEQRDGLRKGIRKEKRDGLRKGIRKEKRDGLRKGSRKEQGDGIRLREVIHEHRKVLKRFKAAFNFMEECKNEALLCTIFINIDLELKKEYLHHCSPEAVAHLICQNGRRKGSLDVCKVLHKLSFADARSLAFDAAGAEAVAQVEGAWFREYPGVATVEELQELFDAVKDMLMLSFGSHPHLPTELGGKDTSLAEQVLLAKQLIQDVVVRNEAEYKIVKAVAQGFVDRLCQIRQEHGQDKLLYTDN